MLRALTRQHSQDAEKPPAAKGDAPADADKEEVATTKAASEAKSEQGGDAINGASAAAEKDEVVVEAEKPVVSTEPMDVDVKPVRPPCGEPSSVF